jgi:hypothetical protein
MSGEMTAKKVKVKRNDHLSKQERSEYRIVS